MASRSASTRIASHDSALVGANSVSIDLSKTSWSAESEIASQAEIESLVQSQDSGSEQFSSCAIEGV